MERLTQRARSGGARNDTDQNEKDPEYHRSPLGAADKGLQNGGGETQTRSKSKGARPKEWKGRGDGMHGNDWRRGSAGDLRIGEAKGAGKGNRDETKGKQSKKVQEAGGGTDGGSISNRTRRSRSRGDGLQRESGGFGRKGEHDANQEKGARSKGVENGERRGAYSVDRKGGERNERKYYGGDKKRESGATSKSTGKPGAPRRGGMGYKSLEELSKKDPSVIAITLSSNPGLPTLLGESTMRQDLVELVCLVVSMAFKSRADRSTLQHLGKIIKDSGFLRTVLPHYLAGMGSEVSPVRRAQYPRQLENILTLLSEVLNIFPASSVLAVSLLLTQFQAAVNTLRALGVDIQPEMEESMENLQDLVKHLQERSREGTLRSDKDTYSLLPAGGNKPDEEDQPDFRTIPIYPTPEELHQTVRPFLRPNLTSQRYTNTQLYLDTHFRLLREDFVKPLREGIQELLFNQMNIGTTNSPAKSKRFDDIRIYYDTQLMVPQCTNTGIAYVVQFDVQPLKFVRWENSKRLIFGSLVCLTCDNFETFLFATVSERKPSDLQKGLVQITFTEESRFKLARVQKDQVFLMVETTAYFEAYRYVLEGLQEQQEDDLPFQRYIVECNTDIQPPAYLRRQDMYDLSRIADPAHEHSLKPFHSLDEQAWPQMEKLGLDESQMRALKLALTKELAIIQGPPGTGKTHVGLKIAQALLTNEKLWRNPRNKAPILVVCYTNHALDQFLEGIHRFLPADIVRVGGRSNSEILKRFNLRELTQSEDFRRSLPHHLRDAFNNIYRELRDEERELQSQSMILECSLKGVLRQNVLQKHISETHWNSLHQPPVEDGFEVCLERKKSSLMMDWLGLGSTVFLQRETEYRRRNEEEAAEEPMEVDHEDLIEIAEEADLIQADRILEDDTDWRGGRDRRQKAGSGEEAVKAVEKMMLAMNLDEVEVQAENSEEGWEIQRDQKKKMKNKIRKELGKSSTMTETEEMLIFDIWALNQPDRWRLYRLWVARYRLDLRTKAVRSEQDYQITADRLAEVKRHQNLCLLKRAKVIGMTTTGAAKYRQILQEVHPTLVIVEEAAEVLEAHTITTLSKACQHLILIGDHQQLRPSATVYELAKNFHLEMSMFERLVNMGLPFVRLNYQHRMRPDIACLLTPHIYSSLENHPSVLDYDNIKGLNTNLFFLEHDHPEEEIKDGRSHQNKHEATFVVELCRYLLLQEYKPEQITILTTYTGQLHCLRKLMPASQFQGVRVHVVDKYQGEENDIVLLSLVRSNLQGRVGFLNIPNRVCVALSRAKKGLYCVGNRAMLSQVKLWSTIFHILSEKQQVGKALTLCCQNHPSRQVNASYAADFKQAPEGGCTQPCEFRLDCGHVCSRVCHPYDVAHKEYKCGKKCQKILCEMGHRCTLVCHVPCPEKCPVMVEKTIPQCQHKQMVPCQQDPKTFACREPCQKTLQCGHPCDSLCGSPCARKCLVKVTLQLKCGHSQKDCCFYKTQNEEPKCRTPCKLQLKCGHTCKGNCTNCYQGRFHSACSHQCERLLICSHKCRQPCTRECPPCQQPCENCCIHSKCCKPCGQPCAPCIEPCTWQCPHQSCGKLCHEPCDRPPCNEPCANLLECGHPCIGLCGDKCPSKCRICNHEEVTEIFFGTEDDPEAYFIELEDCGHIIESTAMDTYMGMDENQQVQEGEEVAIKLKECPKCRTPIRKNLRYGSHINRCLAEIEMVKEKINGPQANTEMYKKALQKQWGDNTRMDEMPEEYWNVYEELNGLYLTANDLSVLEKKMDFLTRLGKLLMVKRENMSALEGLKFMASIQEFVHWLSNKHQKYTEQQVFDLQRELRKLTILAEFNAHCHKASQTGQSGSIQSEVQRVKEVLEKCGQFTEQDEDRVKEHMQELKRKIPLRGLGISEEERKMIVSAMNMRPGHWHKCPNGHVYVIGDCGGAMESRRCPDCTATIGGGNHALASGNQVASEMDGAQHPAWSEANNLLNFDRL